MIDVTVERGRDMLREIYRSDFRSFVKKVFATVQPGTELVWNWHLDAMSDYLEAVRRGDIRRLIINVPPRTTKSITCSVAWSAWLMGHAPSTQIVGASFKEELSIKMNVDTRLVCESEWYQDLFPDFAMSPDQNQKWKFQTTQRGHRIAASVGSGAILGEGGDYLILDDPLNPEQAASEAERKNANEWVRQTYFSRFNDKRKGKFVLIMQRLAEDDVTGHLLEDGGYTHLCLPAEFVKRTVIENPLKLIDERKKDWVKEAGDLLDPVRLGRPELDQALKDHNEYGYAGQYMQNPAPAAGGMVKWDWFKFYEERPLSFDTVIHSWDTAMKVDTGNDYSVGMVWGIRWDGYYLLDLVRKKLKYPDLKAEVKRLYERSTPRYILMEDKGSGTQLLQDYGAQLGIPMLAVMPDKNKVIRLNNVTDTIYAGKVWLPKDAPWLDAFQEELRIFPNGKNDDQVDCLSQFLGWAKINFDRLIENANIFEENKDPLADLYEDRDVLTGRSAISGY